MNAAAVKIATQEIVVEEVFAHTPEMLWKALTTGELIGRWLGMAPTGFEPVIGARFTFQTTPAGPWDGVIRCEVLEVRQGERLSYSWRGGHEANAHYGSRLDTIVTWTLAKAEGGARLRLVHSGFITPNNDSAFRNMSDGWKKVVGRLGAVSAEDKPTVDILHKVGIKSVSPHEVYTALTTLGGLSAWWTNDTRGEGAVCGVLSFRFGSGGFDMKILELVPDKRVRWQVVEGPQEWIGTTISFDLRREGDWTIVFFKHAGWKEPVEFMHHCSTKWGVFLLSLKSLLETGKGAPYPDDIKLDSWE